MNKRTRWQWFATGEGAFKTSHFFLYKWGMSGVSGAFALSFLWTVVVGVIQIAVGLIRASTSEQTLSIKGYHLYGALAFGVVATYMTVLPAWLSSYDEIGPSIFPFMTAVAVIPGLLFDFLGGQSRNLTKALAGVALFIFGVAAYFNFQFDSAFGTWQMALAFTFALAAAINEWIARLTGTGAIDPFTMQFWVGVSTVATCLVGIGLLFATGAMTVATILSVSSFHWFVFALFGALIVPMVFCKVRAYEDGRGNASIVSKKIWMLGTLLILSFLVEWFFFGIERTLSTTVLFLVAMVASYRLLEVR